MLSIIIKNGASNLCSEIDGLWAIFLVLRMLVIGPFQSIHPSIRPYTRPPIQLCDHLVVVVNVQAELVEGSVPQPRGSQHIHP